MKRPIETAHHEMDFQTHYCTRCGASMMQIRGQGLPCHDGVIAISHLRCLARMGEILPQTGFVVE
ncbi:hypothetical protein LCGC14_1614080 [marine sediment metagenome]|uniref:Uncharacterized protein n=1 Tax=marine sediment metagenome TaxID=412755 RepID=A0A0F9I7H1_9ZZZZ